MDIEVGDIFPGLKLGKLQEDEYLGEDGLPYCKKCKTKRFFKYDHGDGRVTIIHTMCKCQEDEAHRIEEERLRLERLEEFKRAQKCSALGKKYLEARFDNSKITEHNKEAYTKCVNYAKNAKEVLQENIGLYVYGDNSSGKSHLLACLCNALIEKGYSCFYTSVPQMIAEIQSSYSDNIAMSQAELITMISRKQFVFIDDLGKEFLGREFNPGMSKFTERILLEVINARYNNGRPTIFSSNYSISELADSFNLDKAIIERINEMATRVIKLEGDDFRGMAQKVQSNKAKKLGI